MAEPDLSLRHLWAELARIDILLRREVRRWQSAGRDPSDDLRGLYVSDADADALLARPFGTSWDRMDPLEAGETQALADALARAEADVQSLAEAARRQHATLRLAQVAAAFELDRIDLDTLLICLAPALDLRYERLYGYLQDNVNRKRPSINLVLDLLAAAGSDRSAMWPRFAPDARLFKHQLLERLPDASRPPVLSQLLGVDEALVAWVQGTYQPHLELGPHASLTEPCVDPEDELMAGAVCERLQPILHDDYLLAFCGPDLARQDAAARLLAAGQHRLLLKVDLGQAVQNGTLAARAVHLALRDARLTGAIPYLAGWDACVSDNSVAPAMLAELCEHPGLAIVAGRAGWQMIGFKRERRMLWVDFPAPGYAQREALWRHYAAAALSDGDLDVSVLAGQFALTAGQIRDACAAALDAVTSRGGPLEERDLYTAARGQSNPRLATLARKIVPRYGWSDIVLPAEQLAILRELIDTVRGRPMVLETWQAGEKLAASAGLTALFAGPPGTGKTMAAEVIAAALGLDLYKIDLATVVSKYIGETEKNLERIFSEAESSNAILFFDEADALFGKRSEVRDSHDRYANIEISYLLQRMEAYNGVTILATNLRSNMDEAFKRRLQFMVDFPFPEEADRMRIWQALFPPEVPRAANLDLEYLARQFKLAGGSIRNIILNAAYLAAADGGQVNMGHLLHGTRRELQKLGRLVNDDEVAAGDQQDGKRKTKTGNSGKGREKARGAARLSNGG